MENLGWGVSAFKIYTFLGTEEPGGVGAGAMFRLVVLWMGPGA